MGVTVPHARCSRLARMHRQAQGERTRVRERSREHGSLCDGLHLLALATGTAAERARRGGAAAASPGPGGSLNPAAAPGPRRWGRGSRAGLVHTGSRGRAAVGKRARHGSRAPDCFSGGAAKIHFTEGRADLGWDLPVTKRVLARAAPA